MQRPRYLGELVAEDMAARGWNASTLARAAKPPVAVSTVTRFISGKHQAPPTAKKLAKALGHPIERYLIRRGEGAAA